MDVKKPGVPPRSSVVGRCPKGQLQAPPAEGLFSGEEPEDLMCRIGLRKAGVHFCVRCSNEETDMSKWVYTFGDGRAEGRAEMKNLLGGKGCQPC